MKRRIGFVSNSSSSSFVIVGNEITFNNIVPTAINIDMMVEQIAEYTVVMRMSKKDYKYLKNNPKLIKEFRIRFFETIASGSDELNIDKSSVSEKFKVYTLEADHYCPDSLEKAIKENGEDY